MVLSCRHRLYIKHYRHMIKLTIEETRAFETGDEGLLGVLLVNRSLVSFRRYKRNIIKIVT
jgi:hypothetical protein